jgi:long-chain acyl-CoA synthetase
MTLLSEIGVATGDRVAISCFNTPEFIYSYFSIVKTGAIVVPINLTLTMEEITYILKDSQTQYLVIHEKILQKLGIQVEQLKGMLSLKDVIVLNEDTNEKVSKLAPAQPIDIDPQSLATILYTSGTTGKPKGAMLSHNNLVENTISCTDALKPVGKDVFVSVLPMFHTFGFTTSVLLPLYIGSSLVIHEMFYPKEIIRSIMEQNISVFCGVPSMFIVLAQALKDGKASFPSLRLAVSGGSPLPVEILTLFNHHYKIPLMEGFGLTEASPVVSFNPVLGCLLYTSDASDYS